MLNKATSSTIFWVFGMTWPGIEPRFPGPLANTLLIRLIKLNNIWIFIKKVFSFRRKVDTFEKKQQHLNLKKKMFEKRIWINIKKGHWDSMVGVPSLFRLSCNFWKWSSQNDLPVLKMLNISIDICTEYTLYIHRISCILHYCMNLDNKISLEYLRSLSLIIHLHNFFSNGVQSIRTTFTSRSRSIYWAPLI